jgi:putative MATE family efflux protein
MIETALVAGFTSVGMDVLLLGPMPTPAVAMLTKSMRADLGVMISASHNLFEDNGIKLFGPQGFKLSDDVEKQIEQLLDEPIDRRLAQSASLGRARRIDGVHDRYIEFAKRTLPRELSLDGLRVVIDCAHGAAYKVVPEALWELGADVVSIGVDPDVAIEARVYVDLRAIGLAPFLLSIALRSYLAAHNITRPLVVAITLGNIANALLDLVLIYGLGPIPAMGTAGAAIATVGVQIAMVATYLAGARAIDGGPARPPSTRADLAVIVRYGLPVGGHLFAEIGIFGLATVLAAHMGKVPVAAHAIALNLASFTFSVAVGVGAATSVRVGHAIGAGDRPLARRRGMLGLGIGVVVMSCFAAVFLAAPRALAGVFSDQGAVIAATIPLLQIAALFQLSDGAQAIAAAALRGIGDNRATFIGNVIGHYGVGLAISLALGFGAGMGAPGLWWGLSVGLTVTAAYLVARFRWRTDAARAVA